MAIKYYRAPDIKQRIIKLAQEHGFENVNTSKIYCFRSKGSTSERILARIWSFPKIWQLALYMEPRYVIEVLSERFDKLSQEKQDEVLIHELKHVPKKFTGGLRKHDQKKLPKHIEV
jgi:predicted metallopeptidase